MEEKKLVFCLSIVLDSRIQNSKNTHRVLRWVILEMRRASERG